MAHYNRGMNFQGRPIPILTSWTTATPIPQEDLHSSFPRKLRGTCGSKLILQTAAAIAENAYKIKEFIGINTNEMFTLLRGNFIRQRAEADAGQGHAFSVFIKFFRLQLGVAGIPDEEKNHGFPQGPIPRQWSLLSAVDCGSLPHIRSW